MDPPNPAEDILMAKSESALMGIPVARLKVFCDDHNVTVNPTGKRGCIKPDFAAAIWAHVSINILPINNDIYKKL
jgi:hypothetical protein